jgi:ActR/RegA family two-component response regulator
VTAANLPANAGAILATPPGPLPATATPSAPVPLDPDAPRRAPRVDDGERRRIEDVLRHYDGNVSATARALGLHRNQLRRAIERYGLVGANSRKGDDSDDSDDSDGNDGDDD